VLVKFKRLISIRKKVKALVAVEGRNKRMMMVVVVVVVVVVVEEDVGRRLMPVDLQVQNRANLL
jgi:hypothetical protein